MQATVRALAVIGVSLLLAACPKGMRPSAGRPGVPPLPTPNLSGANVYAVSAADSRVNILVYRGGAMARLGHNHVMTSQAVQGRVWLHPTLARSGFELSFPVNDLVVDDPQARAAAGSEFPPQIPQADRDGTRKNMLRAEVLDGEHFATVTLQSVRVSGTVQSPTISTRITIKGVARDVDVPAQVVVTDSRLRASGEFDITQSAFGITPFSIGLGALTVQDKLHLKFSIVALR